MPIETITAQQARNNLRGNRFSIWPDGRRYQDRLGDATTCTSRPTFAIDKSDMIFTSGSCFARNIEKKLASLGFNVPMTRLVTPPEERVSQTPNEILNKYTTSAVLNELRWALGIEAFSENAYLEAEDGRVYDPHLRPNLPPMTREKADAQRAEIHELIRILPQCRLFIMTLGLVEGWFDLATDKMLNGAPPADVLAREGERFLLKRQSCADIVADLEAIHEILQSHGHPAVRWILTVSPVPFKATYSGQDALVANCYSKSALRTAAEEFSMAHDNVDYFPSYEMITLSDRRKTYTQDNIHIEADVVSRVMNLAAASYVEGFELPRGVSDLSEYGTTPAQIYKSALILQKQKMNDIAAALFDKIEQAGAAAETGRSEVDFYLNYGIALARAGRNAEAEPHLYRAVALAPDNARNVYKLGLITARLRRPSARAFFERACSLDPERAEYWARLAIHHQRTDNPAEARICLQRALAIEPANQMAADTMRLLSPQAG